MSSVWHRPQCNIGPGISPVTIATLDDSRKRPGSPGLTSSTRRRRVNDEINAHSSVLVAMTGACCGRSGIRHVKPHTPCSLPISEGASTKEVVASTGRITAKTSTSAAPTVLGVSHDRCCGRSGIRHVKRHTHHARFRHQEEHQREEPSPRLGGSLRRPRRAGPDCFRHQYRMPQPTSENICRDTASPASTRPPFPRTLLDERMSCIHQQ